MIGTMTPQVIHFYRVGAPWGEFSNFAPYPMAVDGQLWPTSEHYFQASKFSDATHAEAIRLCGSPREAARLGRDRQHPLRADWETVKDDVMRRALHAKFTQHPALTELLLSTGDAVLVEHTANDAYWADGGDGSGLNRLGTLLMELRERSRSSAAMSSLKDTP